MTILQGITISGMAKELGEKRHTIEQRLIRFGIKPITYEALYDPEVLKIIKDSKRGRPPKNPETPAKPNKGK